MSKEEFTFFYNGPFSQWLKCKFEINDIPFNSAEQYMMAEKAKLFKDQRILNAIMKSTSSMEQKSLGRQVRGFNVEKWQQRMKKVVYDGNYAKFSQNDDLKEVLFLTKGTTLVEASPTDTIWGIGLSEGDKRSLSRSTWLGKNLLGEILTEVREDLMFDLI